MTDTQSDRAPVSVILPTQGETPVVDEVAEQLGSDDELLVVCDHPEDPIAQRAEDLPPGCRLVVAGEPERCSGKANAIAVGMDAATHDRIVWTDDDFQHPPGWLEALLAEYERRGPVSEVPVFVGRDPLSILLEPIYVVGGTFTVHRQHVAWAGAVAFDRGDLEDERAFRRDLERSLSDDGTLTEYLDLTTIDRTRTVPIGGRIRDSLERHVRFTKIVRFYGDGGYVLGTLVIFLVVLGGVLAPTVVAPTVTILLGALYAKYGVRRWTFLLAFPAILAYVPLLVYAHARRTVVWGGRRYRWRSKLDVEVLGEDRPR